MLFDYGAERFDDAGLRDEEQQRKRAVAVFVVLGHQVVDGFVQQARIGEGAANTPALFGRAVAERIVHECRGLIGIHCIQITDSFLAYGWRRIVKQSGDLSEGANLWFVTTLDEIVCGLSECGDVSGPPLIFGAP